MVKKISHTSPPAFTKYDTYMSTSTRTPTLTTTEKAVDPEPLTAICLLGELMNIRDEENSAAFEVFVKVVLPPVVRKTYFKVKKYDVKLSEFVSIADEAFGLVLLENNFAKWNVWEKEGKESAKSIPTKYGQSGTHWASSKETITRYNEFYAMVKEKRSEANNGDVETTMLEDWKKEREGPVRSKRKFDNIEYSTDLTNQEEIMSPMDSFND